MVDRSDWSVAMPILAAMDVKTNMKKIAITTNPQKRKTVQ